MFITTHIHLQRGLRGDWEGDGWFETGSIYGAAIIILFAPRVWLHVQVNSFGSASENQVSSGCETLRHITQQEHRPAGLLSLASWFMMTFIFPWTKTAAVGSWASGGSACSNEGLLSPLITALSQCVCGYFTPVFIKSIWLIDDCLCFSIQVLNIKHSVPGASHVVYPEHKRLNYVKN